MSVAKPTRARTDLGERSALLCLVFWLGLAGPASALDRSANAEADAAFAAAARAAFAPSGVPGLAIATASTEGPPRVLVLGVRRQGDPAPVQPDDPFHLASITKPLTATMVATLVDQGLLRWEETPAGVWPEAAAKMDPRAARLTLAQLLGHRSGLAAFTDLAEIAATPKFAGDGGAQRAAFAAWLLARRPPFTAGEFHYSNAGYGVAAAMAEKATGQSWERMMGERLFKPLAMTTCGFGWPAARRADGPVGHRYRPPHFVPHDLADGYAIRPFLAPAEDVSCSAGDLARFGQEWLRGLAGRGTLLKPATYKTMTEPLAGYGLGWEVAAGAILHQGGAGTFHGTLIVVPARTLTAAALANAGEARPGAAVLNKVLLAAVKIYGGAGEGR